MSNWKSCKVYEVLTKRELTRVRKSDVRNSLLGDLMVNELDSIGHCLAGGFQLSFDSLGLSRPAAVLETLIVRYNQRRS